MDAEEARLARVTMRRGMANATTQCFRATGRTRVEQAPLLSRWRAARTEDDSGPVQTIGLTEDPVGRCPPLDSGCR